MPYLKIQTNQSITTERSQTALTSMSQRVAKQLGKPESYVMVALQLSVPMVFAGTTEPAAFLELKSIGLAESQTKPLSRALCDIIEAELGIRKDRVYIEFTNAAGKMWGWNGDTF